MPRTTYRQLLHCLGCPLNIPILLLYLRQPPCQSGPLHLDIDFSFSDRAQSLNQLELDFLGRKFGLAHVGKALLNHLGHRLFQLTALLGQGHDLLVQHRPLLGLWVTAKKNIRVSYSDR